MNHVSQFLLFMIAGPLVDFKRPVELLQKHDPGQDNALDLAAADLGGPALQQLGLNTIGLDVGSDDIIHMLPARQVVELEGLPEALQHRHPGVERGIRVLKKHLELPPVGPHGPEAQGEQVHPIP